MPEPSQLIIDDHPLLDAAVFLSTWPQPLGQTDAPVARALFKLDAAAALHSDTPLHSDDTVKKAVRDLLRVGGFKPTGRNKPASEYLIKAIDKGWLAPDRGINACVDCCNAISLHSGLPISVVDVDLATAPFKLAICAPDTRYVFNPSGQVIDISGLLSLHDAQGPCGGPVKDSQRTKTHDDSLHTLTVIWGTSALPGRTQAVLDWYLQLLGPIGVVNTLLMAD